MDPTLAGLVTSVPLMILGVGYGLVMGRSLVAAFKTSSPGKAFSDRKMFYLFLVMFVLPTFFLGIVSGVLYGFMGRPLPFLALEIALATLVSPWTALRRSQVIQWRIFFNYLSAVTFGLLIPWLVGA